MQALAVEIRERAQNDKADFLSVDFKQVKSCCAADEREIDVFNNPAVRRFNFPSERAGAATPR